MRQRKETCKFGRNNCEQRLPEGREKSTDDTVTDLFSLLMVKSSTQEQIRVPWW